MTTCITVVGKIPNKKCDVLLFSNPGDNVLIPVVSRGYILPIVFYFYWIGPLGRFGLEVSGCPDFCAVLRGGGIMGCHPMLTENANFVTNALRGDLSTVYVRPWCGHHTCSVHQWIGNWIIPQFDPRMSSLALLEAEIPSPLYVSGKNNVDVFFGVDDICCCLSFMYGCGGSDCG